jgi:hypothetical protein
MSATELKLEIIKKITAIDDELILEEIFRVVVAESKLEGMYKLSDEEKKAVQAGLEDVRAGRVYSSEVADNMIKEWLKK